ncbi:hypothetical protein EDB86DRAFT_652296 [Lactarius hatsudake]|nr:hypothetical protein EDB86DRAFT_652296 [Lactarius hatsudake]
MIIFCVSTLCVFSLHFRKGLSSPRWKLGPPTSNCRHQCLAPVSCRYPNRIHRIACFSFVFVWPRSDIGHLDDRAVYVRGFLLSV